MVAAKLDAYLLDSRDGGSWGRWLADRVEEVMKIGPYRHPAAPIPLRPLYLPAAEVTHLAQITARFVRLLIRTCEARAGGVAELERLLRYERPAESLLTESEWQNRFAADSVRPDIVISSGTPRFVEFNINSAIAGPEQVAALNRLYRRHLLGNAETAGLLPRAEVLEPLPPRSRAVAAASAAFHGDPGPVAVMGWAEKGFGAEEYFADVLDDLNRAGLDAYFALPGQFAAHAGRLHSHRGPVGTVLRMFVTADAEEEGLDLSPVREALAADRVLVLSPEAGSLFASKLALAWLSTDADEQRLSARDGEFVARHLPWTREVRDSSVRWAGRSHDLLTLLRQEQHRFVLKPSNRYGAAGVVMGRDVTPEEWERALSHAERSKTYVAQEFCRPDPVELPVLYEADATPTMLHGTAVFSPMLFGLRLGGMLARIVPDRDRSIVNAVSGGLMNSVWAAEES